jgi:hypothetical protein
VEEGTSETLELTKIYHINFAFNSDKSALKSGLLLPSKVSRTTRSLRLELP